jgi:pimeloyl-ACP methyl ester carboxylesterase
MQAAVRRIAMYRGWRRGYSRGIPTPPFLPMKTSFISLAALLAMSTLAAHAEDAQGYWRGSVANALPVSLQFTKSADGQWEGTLSVPTQNLVTRVEKLVVTPDQIDFALPKFKATYSATWNAKDQAWNGTWVQGAAAPLVLTRTTGAALKPQRPQEDAIAAAPAPYTSSDIVFDNAAGNATLAGTLTVPQGKGPFPAVVLIHGSGPINRDGDVFGHKTLLVLADHLSRHGIAVLRYDKRGVGKSTGTRKDATMLDLAADAEAAVRFLRTRPEVDARRLGVVGHSEGGLIAPLLASRDPALAFAVMLAGPGIRGERLLVEQQALLAAARGVPAAIVARERALNETLFAAMTAAPDLAGARREATRILGDAEKRGEMPAGTAASLVEQFGTPWFVGLMRYEPAPVLQAVRQPVLVLNGERDLQVPAAMDLAAIRVALQGNPRAVVKEMPGLNHLFQTAKTGAGEEYVQIAETFAPAALVTISDWINATAR